MNLKILSNESMITTSAFLLEDARACAILHGHELGRAMHTQLGNAHVLLTGLHKRRQDKHAVIDALGQEMTRLAAVHDRKARGFSRLLKVCIESLDDPDLADFCRALATICFPQDMDVVNRSYLDKAGHARIVAQRVTADMRARMDAMVVGGTTMGALFGAWIDAGIELGQRTNERARARQYARKRGSDAKSINIHTVRSLWIRTMRTLMTCVDLMGLSEQERAELLSPLAHTVAAATRASKSGGGGGGDGGAGNDAAVDGDADGAAVADADAAAAADADDAAVADAAAAADADVAAVADADAAADGYGVAFVISETRIGVVSARLTLEAKLGVGGQCT